MEKKLLNLSDIMKLIEVKKKEMDDLIDKLDGNMYDRYMYRFGEDIVYDDKHLVSSPRPYEIKDILKKLHDVYTDLVTLKSTLNKANNEVVIEFNGTSYTLSVAINNIMFLKEMKEAYYKLSLLNEKRRFDKGSMASESYIVIEKPCFDSKEAEDICKRIDSDIFELQSLIDAANATHYYEVELME